MRAFNTFMTSMSGMRYGFVGFVLSALAVAGCGTEPQFPFAAAKGATAIRIRHADIGVQPSVREISDPAVLQRVLGLIDQFNSWEPIPECRSGTCNDITIEWVSGEQTLVRLSLCNQGHRARVGEPGPVSPCGRSVPAGASAALRKELGERQ